MLTHISYKKIYLLLYRVVRKLSWLDVSGKEEEEEDPI